MTANPLNKSQAYIGGKWVGKPALKVTDPATGEQVGAVPDMGAAETKQAIEAAQCAFPDWSHRLAKERTIILRRWYDLIMQNADALADLLTREQGKPLAEAKGEILYGAAFVEFYAEEAKRVYGETIPSYKSNSRIIVLKQPIGVVGAITPWNFPSAMVTRKVSPALAAGCTVVCKPAEDTPLSALALAFLAEQAGFPPGVFNVVTTARPDSVGKELTANPLVRAITFTGSTEVGKISMRQAADTVKKVSLELGGNAPFIVFDDADLNQAVIGALQSKFRNTGQACTCTNRFFVQDGIYDKFVSIFTEAVRKLKPGGGFEEGVTQGPLINQAAFDKVKELVADATARGAKISAGGRPHALGGTFFEPTVLTDITPSMRIMKEEIFGPIAALVRFKSEEDVIRLANDTTYGLGSFFYTRDLGRAWRVAEALEYGIVGVNNGVISTEVAPFGGVKQSGLGREGSHHGIEEFLEIKYVLMGGI